MRKHFLFLVCIFMALLPQTTLCQNRDLQAFLNGQKEKYFTKGHPKAKGINISIEYPSHWQRSEGERPNIVQKFSGDASDGITRMLLILIEDFPDAVFSLETLKEMVPDGARFLKEEKTRYDGEPGAWMICVMQQERSGFKLEIYILQHVFVYSGKLVMIQCGVGGLASASRTIEQIFYEYLPLFYQMGNSIIIHDKWEKGAVDYESDASSIVGDMSIIEIVLSIFINWVIGLFPAFLLRYVIFRRPIKKRLSGLVSGIIGFLLFLLVVWGSETTPNVVPVILWTMITYWVLHRGYKERKADKQKQAVQKQDIEPHRIEQSDIAKEQEVDNELINYPDAYPPDWEWRSHEVRKRDRYTCQASKEKVGLPVCGKTARENDLHVHHIIPISKGGNHSFENLITLCSDCHDKLHIHMPLNLDVSTSSTTSRRQMSSKVRTLQDAIANEKDVWLDYYTKYRDDQNERIVTPINIYYRNGAAYLHAYCHWREKKRTFRVSRIKNMRVLDSDD